MSAAHPSNTLQIVIATVMSTLIVCGFTLQIVLGILHWREGSAQRGEVLRLLREQQRGCLCHPKP